MFAKYLKTSLFALAVFALALAGCSKPQEAEKIVIKGSTTVLPIAQKAQEAYLASNKGADISLSGTGSGDGIKAIIEGSTDIANASRDMKQKEKDAAAAAGKNIEAHVVAKDMIIPVVHPSNPVSEITVAQLKDIYMGKITNWKELGGADSEIVVISRDTSSGTYEVWEKKVMAKENVFADALLQASNGAVSNAVSNNEKAIGYVGVGYLNDSIKGLAVEGVEPKVENVDTFAIARPLFMFTNKDEIKPGAQAFIDFVMSADGQKLVKEAGFVPVK